MSGVCGVVGFAGGVDASVVGVMAQAAVWRAPDGVGRWDGAGVGLAALRMVLTPESVGQAHPVVDGDVVLVADARVDNREQLRSALAGAGRVVAAGVSDEALLLAAYQVWGQQCAERLVGDFVFVVYDAAARRVFAARDAMGMRSLYHRWEPGRFLFATEVKQILAAPGVPDTMDELTVAAHLAGPYHLPDRSFYAGVAQLAPGHALVADASGVRSWRFWDVAAGARVRYRRESDYVEHFRELFSAAVGARLRSVKPVGLFLSGGLDSGSVAATAGWLLSRGAVAPVDFRAYCWAFEELAQCDERHVSSLITGHYGLAATDVSADDAWPLSGYPDHGPDRDEPLIGVYQPLIEHTLEAARRDGVGPVLGGDRGDLIVGPVGLDYVAMLRRREMARLLREIREHRAGTGEPVGLIVARYVLREFARTLRRRTPAQWGRWMLDRRGGPTAPGGLPPWIHPDLGRRTRLDERLRALTPRSPLPDSRGARHLDVVTGMHQRGVVWSERTYARFGLGFADPFSDRRLAEWAVAVPQAVVNRPGSADKRLSRAAMRGIMPESARIAARKIVPEPLYEQALRVKSRDTFTDLLSDMTAQRAGFVDGGALRHHYRAYLDGAPLRPEFWWAVTLEMWLRRHGG